MIEIRLQANGTRPTWRPSERAADGSESDASAENEEVQREDEILPVQFGQLEEPPLTKAKCRPARLNNVLVEIIVELGRRKVPCAS